MKLEDRTRLFIPGLAGFYDWAKPYCYPLIRFTAGAIIIPNGWPKVTAGLAATTAIMVHEGLPAPALAAICVTAIETIGGLCVAIGLFTRFWAAALAVELAVIAFVAQLPNGYPRFEQFLLWGVLAFVIALRGGGHYSVDRLIGGEL